LIALTPGGTWRISPVSLAISVRSASAETPLAGAPPDGSPSASSVVVDWPSRIVATYSFSVSDRYRSAPNASSAAAIADVVAAVTGSSLITLRP